MMIEKFGIRVGHWITRKWDMYNDMSYNDEVFHYFGIETFRWSITFCIRVADTTTEVQEYE